ncbi:hypothetical protein M011DRAFT_497838 [Sporormia fimetaria CBS 119925]|uniref:Mitochondrial outer membrane transport complex Sam37/metaxin N-terminal domain-containing protein n=1 Tax=Sporormia fimetaria CBS 119925 TaxID=1340428 RepID=A0A6A6UVP5_9PLEO|nr:hypothetical protein M011DRAFT_497838 [Sporormia fimetaria CBS 119925]
MFELHVWGPAFGLPSIDADCLAAIAYLKWAVPIEQWILIADYDVSLSPGRQFPLLVNGTDRVSGLTSIISYFEKYGSGHYHLNDHLNVAQRSESAAFSSFLQSTAGPLIDLSLYVSAENYNATTASAYTAILPWYLNYTVPPARRDLARTRTAHLGLSSLDISLTEQNSSRPGAHTLGSQFETAKQEAGLPPRTVSLGRRTGVQGVFSAPVYAARIRLDALANEVLEPLSDLLGSKKFLLDNERPSALDCAAIGYLALLFYPDVPQAWLQEALKSRFPRLVAYIDRVRSEVFGAEVINAADVCSSLLSTLMPRKTLIEDSQMSSKTVSSSLPSPLVVNGLVASLTALIAAVAAIAIHHRRSPREGDLIFWALRPREAGLGEAGSILSSRAPTASQIQNPPPPVSTTKTGRFFGKANLGHTFRHKSAGAFGPDLAKKLSQLVKMEKNVMRSMELVSRERMEVAQQLSIWGEACDDDVSDVTDKLGVLIYEIGELEDQFVDRYDQYRVTMKSIRNIEASVQPSRDRKQKITDQIAQLKYKEPNSPKIVVLEQELVRAEAESLVAEAQLSNITREKLKAAFNYQFDALREHCEKLAIIAGYGKHLLELIDDTPVTPGETRNAYDGYEASKAIIQDCEDALTNWVQQNAAVSSKLSTRARTLSQRRRSASRRRQGEGVDLSGQDQPMEGRESGLWIPASEHQGNGYEDELEEDAPSTVHTETRGREEERVAA